MAKKKGKVLVLRTCKADMSSTNGFKWPESGYVEAPDWEPTHECGNGLHGWLWGEGDGGLGDSSEDAKWLVVEVDADEVIDLDGKVKFPSGNVIFCGSRKGATNYLSKKAPGKTIIGASVTAGHGGRVLVGDRGMATAGKKNSIAVAGNYGTARVESYGVAVAGGWGIAEAGTGGVSTVASYGTATAGYRGTATAGYRGTATAGDYGIATAGYGGTAMAGDNGALCITYFDGKRHRIKTAYVGEDGILPNVMYRLDDDRNFVAE